MTSQPDNDYGTLGEIMPNNCELSYHFAFFVKSARFIDECQQGVKALASVKARRGGTTICAYLSGYASLSFVSTGFSSSILLLAERPSFIILKASGYSLGAAVYLLGGLWNEDFGVGYRASRY